MDEATDAPAAAWRPDLVEEMRFDPLDGIVELERHLARLKANAAALGIAADRHAVRNELHAATFRLTRASRVRLRVVDGASAIATGPLPAPPSEPVPVALAPLPTGTADLRRRPGTGDRAPFRDAREAAGTWEVLFVLPDGSCGEGSFATLFVPRGDRLLTPPLPDGSPPGILRGRLVDEGAAIEARLCPDDLADGFFVGTMLHGLVAARRA